MLTVFADLNNKKNFVSSKEEPIPKPGKNEILFKTLACGVCSTDIEYLTNKKLIKKDGKMFNAYVGKKYLGHEVVGKAIRVGKSVDKELINKNFVVADTNMCKSFNLKKECENCKKKQGIQCQNKAKRNFNKKVFGGYSEYFIRSKYQSHIINTKVNIQEAIFSEPLAGAINCFNSCKKDDRILIIGLGTISSLFYRTLLTNNFKNKNIYLAVENNFHKLQAKKLKINNIILKKDLKKKKIKFNKIFYFNGKIDLNEIALNNLFSFSSIFLFGHLKEIKIEPKVLIKKEIQLKGIHGYSSKKINNKYISDIETAINYIEKKKIILKDLINFKYKLKNTKNVLNNICQNIKKKNKKIFFRSILIAK